MRAFLAAALLMLSAVPVSAATDAELKEIRSMHWKDATNVALPDSRSSITLPGFLVVQAGEAARLRQIVDSNVPAGLEADAMNFKTQSEIVFSWFPSGYVSSEDWGNVDADSFLSQLKANTEESNKQRRANGIPTLTVLGWQQPPRLNRDTHTVSWSILAEDSTGAKVLNSVALKLGRFGFEKILWIVNPSDVGDRNDLLLAENNHHFNDGARYVDYVPGTDHAAEYGVAGLVAGALGVKLLKAAGAGALIIGLKKFGVILILPFVWAWRKFTGLFKRKPKEPP